MRTITVFWLLLLLATISNTGSATPISASELFRSSTDFSYKLNPSSKYTAHHFFRSDGYDVIELLDIENNKKGDVFRLKTKKIAKILEHFWIDEDTLYVSYRISKKKEKRVFIEINLKKFESGDEDYTSSREIKVKGFIIDPLKDQSNTFLFQRPRSSGAQVYKLTTAQLIANEFEYKNKVRPSIPDAVAYTTDRNGEVRFGYNIVEQEVVYWYLDKQENDWVEIHRYGDDDSYFEPVGLLGLDKLAVISNANSDLRVLMEYNLKTKRFGKILYQHDKYDIFSAQTSIEPYRVLSVSYSEHGRLMTQYFSDEDSQTNSTIKKKLPGKQFFTISQNKGSSKKILVSFASDDSGKFYWFDTNSEKIIPLNSLYKNHENLKFTKTQLLTVNNVHGQPIEAFLTRPDNGNGVLIVNPHGGPIDVRDNADFNRTLQYFASRGYSILRVNFRGSAGLGKEFMDAGRGQFGKNIESDITSVVKQVKSQYKYKHTCSMGVSYGGYSALVLVAQNPADYDCAVARYGVYDLPLLFNRSNIKMNDDYIDSISKIVGDEKDLLKEQSPINFAEEISVPVLLIAGLEDEVAGFEQSNRMKYRLKQLNKDVETMFYSDTGHGYHSKWYWDWHEHAYIDNFIRHKLKIKTVETKEGKRIIADEAMMISDGFEFDNKVKIDREKAFGYLKIAAEQDLPRAVHNLAAYYNNSKAVKKDIDKALELYARASKLGWSNSSDYLGQVYRDGVIVKKDLEKSFHYFEAGHKQESKYAWFDILRAKCSGWGVDVDIDYCISGMTGSVNRENNLTTKQRKIILEDVLYKPWSSAQFKEEFLNLLSKLNIHNIDNAEDFIAEKINLYAVEGSNATISNGSLKRSNYGRSFSLKYHIKDGELKNNKRFAIKVNWQITNANDGATLYESEDIYFTTAGTQRTYSIKTSDKKYSIEGEVKITIENLQGDILFSDSSSFNLKEDV